MILFTTINCAERHTEIFRKIKLILSIPWIDEMSYNIIMSLFTIMELFTIINSAERRTEIFQK